MKKLIHQAFHLFDLSGDGEIEYRDLCDALRVLGQNPQEHEFDAFLSQRQEEHDKKRSMGEKDNRPIYTVNFPEFLVILNKRRQDALTNRVRDHWADLGVQFLVL